MTAWVSSFGWNWLLVPVAAWFLNGLRKAALKPRVRLLSYSKAGGVHRLEVERQELLPPWRTLKEVWISTNPNVHEPWRRAVDGWRPCSGYSSWQHAPQDRFDSLVVLADAEKRHTDAVLGDMN